MSQLQVTGEAKIRDIQGPVVANSGVVTALDGAASQYVRGDGTLADFPTSSGGGSSVSYYLNSSVSQGTIGGVAYRQLSKTPISGAGTDITASTNGYIASYITDANDPALLEVPAGNFNCEFYFSVNSNNHDPYVYAELYKYDGTTFTLLGSNVAIPEYLTNGTTLSAYYFAIPVAVAALTITDRLAIRIYVNVDGRVVTLHTENNHLCQVVTTFSKGLISLNNLTRQNQFFGTGTSGTDFNISSVTATHTFNLPVASATNTGKLSSTDWSTFNGKVPYTGATGSVDLGIYSLSAGELNIKKNGSLTSAINFEQATGTSIAGAGYTSIGPIGTDGVTFFFGGGTNSLTFKNNLLTSSRTYSFPDASGTLALLEAENKFTLVNSFDQSINYKTDAVLVGISGYISQAYAKSGSGASSILSMKIADGNSVKNISLDFIGSPVSTPYSYLFPAFSGTIALLEGSQTFSGAKTFSNTTLVNTIYIDGVSYLKNLTSTSYITGYTTYSAKANGVIEYFFPSSFKSVLDFNDAADYTYTFPAASGTIALTSNLSSYVPYTGATGAVDLGTNELTSGNAKINDTLYLKLATTYAHISGYYGISVGTNIFVINNSASTQAVFSLASLTTSRTFTLPDANGTLALTSNLSAYLPLTGGTLTGALSGKSILLQSNSTTTQTLKIVPVTSQSASILNIVNSADTVNLLTVTSAGNVIMNGGNVGIGTSSPASTLSIGDAGYSGRAISASINSAAYAVTFRQDSASGLGLQLFTSQASWGGNAFTIDTSSSTLFRITSGGNVGIGTTSPSEKLQVLGNLRFTGNNITTANTLISEINAYAGSSNQFKSSSIKLFTGTFVDQGFITFNTSISGADVERMRIAENGNVGIGVVPSAWATNVVRGFQVGFGASFSGNSSASDAYMTSNCYYDGSAWKYINTGNNALSFDARGNGGDFIWQNAPVGTAGGTVSFTERMRITSGGNVLIGTTSGTGRLCAATSGTNFLIIAENTDTAGTNHTLFYGKANGSDKFYVLGTGTVQNATGSYTTISDERLKENVIDATPKLEDILKLRVVNYNLISGETDKQIGFIAQEAEKVFPSLVYDFTEQSSGNVYKGFKLSILVPILVKAVQEQTQIIKDLEARIVSLESK
jgi:hypothetical protein